MIFLRGEGGRGGGFCDLEISQLGVGGLFM